MSTFADTVIEPAKESVGYSLATSLSTDDYQEQKLIAETILVGITYFLLNKYFESFFEGLGFNEMAKKHGKTVQKLLRAIRKKKGIDKTIGEAKTILNQSGTKIEYDETEKLAHMQAIEALSDLLYENGASREQANNVAKNLSNNIKEALMESSNNQDIKGE